MPLALDLTGQTIKGRKVLSRGPNVGSGSAFYVYCDACGKTKLVSSVSLRQDHGCRCTYGRKKSTLSIGDAIGSLILVERSENLGKLPTYIFERRCGCRIRFHCPAMARAGDLRGCKIHDKKVVEHDGCTMTMEEWAAELGIRLSTFYQRLSKFGPDDPRTFESGRMNILPRKPLQAPDGSTVGASEASRELGISRQAISQRLLHGWPEDLAVSVPKYGIRSINGRHCRRCGEVGHNSATCERRQRAAAAVGKK